MKKSIVLTLIVALLLAMTSSVFAATTPDRAVTVTLAAPEAANVGDEITVSVHFSEAVNSGISYVKYEAAQLKYVSSDLATAENTDGSVKLAVKGAATTDVKITFEVLAEGNLALSFENKQLVAKDNALLVPEALPTATVKVAGEIVVDPGTDTETQKPAEKGDKEESGKPGQYPKTGVNYVVAGGVLLSLISLVAVAKKM